MGIPVGIKLRSRDYRGRKWKLRVGQKCNNKECTILPNCLGEGHFVTAWTPTEIFWEDCILKEDFQFYIYLKKGGEDTEEIQGATSSVQQSGEVQPPLV